MHSFSAKRRYYSSKYFKDELYNIFCSFEILFRFLSSQKHKNILALLEPFELKLPYLGPKILLSLFEYLSQLCFRFLIKFSVVNLKYEIAPHHP